MEYFVITKFFVLFCLIATTVSARMSLALAREDEDPSWIVDIIDPKCSKPCGGGVRRVIYKCAVYKHSTGETFNVDESRCNAVTKPPELKPCNQEKCYFDVMPVRSTRTSKRYKWKSTNSWSKCINGCFGGTRCIVNRCWDNTVNDWASDNKCIGLDEPRKLCETCREFVSCPPLWRKSEWSICSRTCGSGVRTREVFCANQIGAEHFTKVDSDKCKKDSKPHSSERCSEIDCPPEFVATKWGPCKNANSKNCGIGARRRKVQCVKTMGNGVTGKVAFRQCVRRVGIAKFPPMWTTCTDYNIKLSDNCKRKRTNVTPRISVDNTTIYQMKRSKRLRLQVGETAYVLPRTTLIMKCPVKDFDPRDLVWMHNKNSVNTRGRRVQMNYRGRLRIRSVRRRDKGIWSCIAGVANASISLHLQYPTEGFREYAIRQPLLTKLAKNLHNAMMSDSTGIRKNDRISGRQRRPVQWVAGPWTPCSRTCGGPGVMRRQVQCERVKDTFYKVYKDKKCTKVGLEKPPETKKCGGFNVCPLWQIDSNRGKCTNQCVRPGFALQKDRVFCGMNNQRLPLKFCNQEEKPNGVAECVNSECQLAWKASNWSDCSRTCGGLGVKGRSIECIWKNTGALAGFNCYRFEIPQPLSVKTCNTPKCILECIDLTPQCDTIKPSLCRYAPYQRYCCKKCEKYSRIPKLKRKVKRY